MVMKKKGKANANAFKSVDQVTVRALASRPINGVKPSGSLLLRVEG